METTLKIAATALLITAMFGPSAFAQQERGHRLAACKADVEKFCASEPRGHGRIRACLEANKDKVAPECKTALEAMGPGKGQ